jgi:[acyl-carrier-protein] S-malonyltransferase
MKNGSEGLVFLFAGQGSQTVGMGVNLARSCERCRVLLESADAIVGFPLSRIMAEGPEEKLCQTEIAQPAILTVVVANALHLMERGYSPAALVGHSLGQYAALVVADSLDFESAARLVRERGRLMQQTVPNGNGLMMAIVGLERRRVYQACEEARPKGVVNVACHNAPNQTVIAGSPEAVSDAASRCENLGGGVVPLSVSAPFHCELLQPMIATFAGLVEQTKFSDPLLPVIDNVTALPLRDAASIKRSLIAQVTSPVLFEESLRYLAGNGAGHFIQCGPGRSLLNFAKKVVPTARFQEFEEVAV